MDEEMIIMVEKHADQLLSFESDQNQQQILECETICCEQSQDNEQEIRIDDKDKESPPLIGMNFDSLDDAKKFYMNYAYNHGFGVVVRTSKIKGNGDNTTTKYHTFICEKGGKPRRTSKNSVKLQPSIKTDCKAKLNVKEFENGKVVLTKVIFEHNHGLSPDKSRHLKSHKKIDSWVKRRLELNDQAGIPVNKNFQSFVIQAGGYENLTFEEKKFRNCINEAMRLRLGVGDAQSINNYFIQMQLKDANFFYAMDLNENGQIKNIFWADARSRALYESFGDAITFDTTYLTNKYAMPFAPFVGVDHHGDSILLGCGLLSKEDIESYIWLFETWLRCMSGVSPKAIVTDQCKAIGGAVAIVFKEAKHRLCLWHIMFKIPSKLNKLKDYKPIKKVLKRTVYESLTVEEFEENWLKLIVDYKLNDNKWLETLYEIRKQWVPIFVKDNFWAGMSTTQRSESMNFFFDGYVNHKTSLKEFVEQYDNALKSKVEKELQADAASFHSTIPTITSFRFEKQFQEAYTNNIFTLFQDELRGLMACNAQFVKKESSMYLYKVNDRVESKNGIERAVFYDFFFIEDECDVNCVCRWFEFRGILCRHTISVLVLHGVKEIPSRYILARWRKNIKRKHNTIKSSYDGERNIEQVKRYDMLYERFRSLAITGAMNDQSSKFVMEALEQLENKLKMEIDVPISQDKMNYLNNIIKSPCKVNAKGRPRTKRLVSKNEEIVVNEKKKVSRKNKGSPKENDVTQASRDDQSGDVAISLTMDPSTHLWV